MRRRALAGLIAAALGLGMLWFGQLANALPLGSVAVSGIGGLTVVVGLEYLRRRRGTLRNTADVDPPEPGYRSTVPGEDVDADLAAGGAEGAERRSQIRHRLREVTAEVLVANGGYRPEGARQAVDDGTWTDDEVAAGYLAEPMKIPPRLQVRQLFRRRSTTRVFVRHTLDALREVRGGR
ncbi:hypothetical protein HWV23_12525 [Natronomonas halophila]|uniref:DUF7269 family protein n=1 Tax=Natronomonas halophila TaxID=2747817 RepID=UPI0015B42C82|nr:hypothetical protein [Natronomonas halophila]QLD86517.1 hypothetical protein HWV23_12525 [Natronomonas halophila]